MMAYGSVKVTIPEGIWYLSFVKGKHVGSVFLEAPGEFMLAVSEAHRLGLNPGGEVAGFFLPEYPDAVLPDAAHMNRLLSMEELRDVWPDVRTEREWKEREAAESVH